MQPSRELSVAIFLWRRGQPIPVDLTLRLLDQGLDVSRLQSRYAA